MALDLSALDDVAVGAAARQVAPTAPPEAFEEDPGQPRVEFDDETFAALVEDVRRRGILQPLVVRRLASGRLRIRFGARRLRAALCAGLARIPYVETEDERQFDDYAQVAENAHRWPLQPLELARFVAAKLAAGERRRAIAAKLQIDASAVTHLLALAGEPPPLLLELYHGRRCRSPYYLYLLRKLLRRDAALVARCVAGADEIDRRLIVDMTLQLQRRVPAMPLDGTVAEGAGSRAPAAAVARAGIASAETAGVLTRPQLLGHYRGRTLEVLLRRAPSAEGLAWVRYDDGELAEVPLVECTLTGLRQHAAGR